MLLDPHEAQRITKAPKQSLKCPMVSHMHSLLSTAGPDVRHDCADRYHVRRGGGDHRLALRHHHGENFKPLKIAEFRRSGLAIGEMDLPDGAVTQC